MRGPPCLFPALPALNMLDQFPSAPGIGGFLLYNFVGRHCGLGGCRIRQHDSGYRSETCHKLSPRTGGQQRPLRVGDGNVHSRTVARCFREGAGMRRQHRVEETGHQPDAPAAFAFPPGGRVRRVQAEYFRSRVHRSIYVHLFDQFEGRLRHRPGRNPLHATVIDGAIPQHTR